MLGLDDERRRDKEGFQVVETDLSQLEPREEKEGTLDRHNPLRKRRGVRDQVASVKNELGRAAWHDVREKTQSGVSSERKRWRKAG